MEKQIQKLVESLGLNKEVLAEDFVTKIGVLLEAQLVERKKEIEAELVEQNEAELAEFKTELVNSLSSYVSMFTEKFIEENQEELYAGVQIQTAQKVLEKVESLVQELNINLSDDSLSDEFESDHLKEELNAMVSQNLKLEREIEHMRKSQIISELADDIYVNSAKDSFITLAEGFDFADEETFKERLSYLKESINISEHGFNEDLDDQETLDNQNDLLESVDNGNPDMKQYLTVMQRTAS